MWIGLAIGLAYVLSLAELLTKYENKLLKYIVNQYLIIYLIINGTLAFVLYIYLPHIGSKILAPEWATAVNHDGWYRSLIAGLGYPFILRSKLFNVRIAEKEVPLGGEMLYLALSKYLIDTLQEGSKVLSVE